MENNLPTKFQIGDSVRVNLQIAGTVMNSRIRRVIRAQYKTYYDVEVTVYAKDNELETTILKEVDEFFIEGI